MKKLPYINQGRYKAMNETNVMLSKILEAVQILQAESSANRLEFAKIHGKLDGLSDRMDGLESKMDGLENRMNSLESRVYEVETQMHDRFDQIETKMTRLKIGQKRLSEKIFEQDMEISLLREA